MARIYDATATDFENELVGRKIVAISDTAIILDNGTTLVMEDTSSCCAYFEVTGVNAAEDIADNVITAVTQRDAEGKDEEGFTIVVLSEAKELATIDIDGTASSGYYCHSINLNIKKKEDSK